MAAIKVLGSGRPVETKIVTDKGDRDSALVEVEGTYSDLEKAKPSEFCPSNMDVESSSLSSTGDGMGRLAIRCIKYADSSASAGAVRTTFSVSMQEVQYDLEDHPALEGTSRDEVLKWLATDEAKRIDEGTYKYDDKDGETKPVTDQMALKFCAAYMAGIKTFNRYYPVIEKISIYKSPPGMSRIERSYTGGSPQFSSNIGRFSTPPLSLDGFPGQNWFKSGDNWQQNTNTTWTRTETWTYTPEGSSGPHAWIYNS